jgi:VIT1/CCC1 family predicted Fe2+/Mn2+ transporter
MHRHRYHTEHHAVLGPVVREAILGLSDGITVPFAIAAGLVSASTDATIIIAAVLSEIVAGSISMGLGEYLAMNTEAEHYARERKREESETENKPEVEKQEVADIFQKFGLSEEESERVTASLSTRKKDWVDFMMRFELGLLEPDKRQALKGGVTIALAYALGGLIPLSPYIFLSHDVALAFKVSIAVTVCTFVIFGYIRGRLVASNPWKGVFQTVLIGSIAATAAFLIAKLVS